MPQGIALLPATRPGGAILDAPDEVTERMPPGQSGPYIVILYDCDCHSFEEVEEQLQKAIGCTLEKAEAFALEVHEKGRSLVFSGSEVECEKVASILRQIRLQVETDRSA